jgi:hypothetical protein
MTTDSIVGKKFNELTVLSYCDRAGKKRNKRYLCRCSCGKQHISRGDNLVSGAVKSCGCLRHNSPPNKTHGMKHHAMYGVWQNMKNRCYREKDSHYANYGGKGVTVCDEWKTSFESFRDWMWENGWKQGLEIDREDNDGNYSPENCRIVTRSENLFNKGIYSTSKTGFVGVSIFNSNQFKSSVSMHGKVKHIGLFKTIKEAVVARNVFILANNIPNKTQSPP